MKKIVLIGGNGQIGTILAEGLKELYDIYVMDIDIEDESEKRIKVDARNYDDLKRNMPEKVDVIVNLLSIPQSHGVVDIETMDKMVDVFFKATYNILNLAVELNIPRVVFSSSNHTTDYYEENGHSSLGREIEFGDYPYSKGLYGVMKLASENIGFAFHNEKNLSVINLRIGTVRADEVEFLKSDDRAKRTILSNVDTVELYRCAIETDIKYGTYYGVSDNANKPWSMDKTYKELGFRSKVNSADLVDS